jgi:arylsulfatase A-like enzyme
MPGKIKPGSRNHDIVGGLDLMATFASVAGLKLPEKDREGQPIRVRSRSRAMRGSNGSGSSWKRKVSPFHCQREIDHLGADHPASVKPRQSVNIGIRRQPTAALRSLLVAAPAER